jgi:hypothetical protein
MISGAAGAMAVVLGEYRAESLRRRDTAVETMDAVPTDITRPTQHDSS